MPRQGSACCRRKADQAAVVNLFEFCRGRGRLVMNSWFAEDKERISCVDQRMCC